MEAVNDEQARRSRGEAAYLQVRRSHSWEAVARRSGLCTRSCSPRSRSTAEEAPRSPEVNGMVPRFLRQKCRKFRTLEMWPQSQPGRCPGRSPRVFQRRSRFRAELSDGLGTTVHMAAYDLAATEVRVVALAHRERLHDWCARAQVAHALVGGFFVTTTGEPLGELRGAGIRRPSIAVHGALGRDPLVRAGGGRRGTDRPSLRAAGRSSRGPAPGGTAAGPRRRAGDAGRRGPRGLCGRKRAVRLRHHRRAASSRGARRRPRGPGGGGLRRARGGRCRPVARRARAADGIARDTRKRSTSTAAALPRSCATGAS